MGKSSIQWATVCDLDTPRPSRKISGNTRKPISEEMGSEILTPVAPLLSENGPAGRKSRKILNFLRFRNFQDTFLRDEKIFCFRKIYILKSKICSGIQKSYLENRASILKSFKIKNPTFFTNIIRFPYIMVQCYVYLPLTLCVPVHDISCKNQSVARCD